MLNWLKLTVFAITLIPFYTEAQSFYAVKRNRNLLINGGSGLALYQGEMVNPRQLGIAKPNVTVGAEYFFMSRLSARVGVTWFQIAGDDAKANDDRQQRNLSFRSNNIELAATGAISLLPKGSRFYQRARINLHAFIGVGIVKINPKTYYQGDWVALQPLETEGVKYKRLQPVIPFGLGARLKIDPFFNILIEGGYRKTFTDYLDDVSSVRYPDPAILKSDLSRALSDRRPEIGTQPSRPTQVGKRGNPEFNDGYFIASVTIQYYLPTEIFRNQHKLYNVKRRALYRKK
jgi:hypothetical protein